MIFFKKSALSFLITGLLIILSDSAINAQDVCHLVQLKVDKVKGRVVTNDEIPYPFSSTKVELFREKKGGLIGSTITDKNGFFEIENIGKGEYVLVVWATTEKGLTLFTYDVNLHVTNRNKNESSNEMIYIKLGGDCFDSDAKLGEEIRTESSGNGTVLWDTKESGYRVWQLGCSCNGRCHRHFRQAANGRRDRGRDGFITKRCLLFRA